MLPLATYCNNVAPSVDDLESHYYLAWYMASTCSKEGLSNLQNYCRYMGDQPRRLVVLLVENRMAEPAANKKITTASDLKIGQLVVVEHHHKGPFDPTYIYDH